MGSASLVWAGVPHNGDGVVFQVRITRGLQRFHISRAILEAVHDLERLASDARQLTCFYEHLEPILGVARKARSDARADTVPLSVSDFVRTVETRTGQDGWAATQRATQQG
ncbi:hypothetical protein [Burkholderia stagnalis]|uniref:hypothetical protein n=1 Tax=Burkholderia stagnalis TaxID=1503054 RepID=UPI000757EF6E|nr:hypothetical protein [Burkholderia stagnalis]KVN17300.1 hypothetical protein WT09_13820 [Burkholderia stagnalis]KVN27184.1 hypothetical protein WT11_29300 [Burkholderia stagnalis]RQQ56043.1 hypothetical protein DF145_00860 [Burkholderia stagnalis]RQY05282.1 hypothetical protein DF121_03910 [Burkholderia stagnalis]RQY22781.1 hypothetical protein DF115_03685 [Burkholderia stagnalis]